MVCSRCKMVVRSELKALGLDPISVELGEIELKDESVDSVREELNRRLKNLGFELISDKKSKVIEKIKNLIIDLVHYQDKQLKTNLSTYLAQQCNQDYSALSNLFSEVEGITIEKFYLLHKIEKVKELLIYDELSLSEIADQLNYSSVSHLSSQFKKLTGFTPSYFKQIKDKKHKQIEDL